MIDILVLEDYIQWKKIIENQIPAHLTRAFQPTSEDFMRFVEKQRARLYLLDDEVPARRGQPASYSFIENCDWLLARYPNSRVWYAGRSPQTVQRAYCHQKGIPMIDKTDLRHAITTEFERYKTTKKTAK